LQKTCHCLARGSTGSPTMVRQAHQPWFDCAGEGIFLWQDFLFLAKEYRAKEGGLARAEAFCFCNHSKNLWMDFSLAGFSLPCQGIPSQGRRVSSMQKHSASAIIQKIHGWIFLWQDFLFLAKKYRAKDGGLARAEAFCFCNPKKIQGWIFLWQDFLFLAKEYRAMEGGLAACRSILLLQSFKKSMDGFFFWQDFFFLAKEYRAMEGGLAACRSILLLQSFKKSMDGFFECRRPTRDWRGGEAVAVGNGAVAEPRKARGAK